SSSPNRSTPYSCVPVTLIFSSAHCVLFPGRAPRFQSPPDHYRPVREHCSIPRSVNLFFARSPRQKNFRVCQYPVGIGAQDFFHRSAWLRCECPGFVRQTISNYRSEEHTSELQSREKRVCRLLLEKKEAKMNWT